MRSLELKTNCNISTVRELLSAKLPQETLPLSTMANIHTYSKGTASKDSVKVCKCLWKIVDSHTATEAENISTPY